VKKVRQLAVQDQDRHDRLGQYSACVAHGFDNGGAVQGHGRGQARPSDASDIFNITNFHSSSGKLEPKRSPSPVKSSALHRMVTFPGVGIEIVSRQSPTFQSGPSSPQLLLTTCQVVELVQVTCRGR